MHGMNRNPVIVIPGILGSKLVDGETGRIVWGAFERGYADPRTDSGARLVSLPMRQGASLWSLQDKVQPAGVLDRVRVNVVGLPVELNAYLRILGTLGVGGYRDELLGQAGAIDYGELNGLRYLVMEFVEGQSVLDLLNEKGALGARRSLEITVQVCRALGHAASQGIIHRDIKPANIVITGENRAVLVDFGLARIAVA